MELLHDEPVSESTVEHPYSWFARHTALLPDVRHELPKGVYGYEIQKQFIAQEHESLWKTSGMSELEQEADEEKINAGIPSQAMATIADRSMLWKDLVLSGISSPSYAIRSYIEQLSNSTLVSVLLAGFAISSTVDAPDFDYDTGLPQSMRRVIEHIYGFSMLFSGMNCFAATCIALHAVNRLSNALPSKSSTAYMTRTVFDPARHAVQRYIYRGILGMVVGLTCAFMQSFAWLYGVPSALLSVGLCAWLVALYSAWDVGCGYHNWVADRLASMDIAIAAEGQKSISEGLVHS